MEHPEWYVYSSNGFYSGAGEQADNDFGLSAFFAYGKGRDLKS